MHVIRDFNIEEAPDKSPYDLHLEHPSQLYAPSLNSIPLQGAVQVPRLFYGNRFDLQAISHVHGEAPLVQNLDTSDPQGRSFDEINGEQAHIVRAPHGGIVKEVAPHHIRVQGPDGDTKVGIYHHMPSNQKSGIHSRPVVQPGTEVRKGDLLAASNYTDDKGVSNMGINVRVANVPWRGHTMDDAIVVSDKLAERMRSEHYKTLVQETGNGRKHDLSHYRSIFATAWPKEILERFDHTGLIKPGTIVNPNEPLVLATSPRVVTSGGANVGKLTRALSESRRDDSMLWEEDDPAEVVDARQTKNGMKVVLRYTSPLKDGDKVVFRPGAKATVARPLPEDQMPRTADGKPLEVLLNPLSLFSRANPNTAHEMRLGKVAEKIGQPLKLPSYLPPGITFQKFISDLEKQHGVEHLEPIIDPETGRTLDRPVAVGNAFLKKLHHVSSSKISSRGTGGYDANEQPLKGGYDSAQAKRFSGLENVAALSSGAYSVIRENATIKGQKNDAYHRALRSGHPLPKAGEPFVWGKLRALLAGAGIRTRDLGGGKIRLAPMTDKHLASMDPVEVTNGGIVDLRSMEPVQGGLFDSRIATHDRWGKITLPRPVINPAYEESARVLLGLTRPQLADVLRGRQTLDGQKVDQEPPPE